MHRKPHIRRPFLSFSLCSSPFPFSSTYSPLLLRVVMASFVSFPFLILLFLFSSPFSSPPPSLAAPNTPRRPRISHHSPSRLFPKVPSASSSTASSQLIAQACNATRYTDTCQSTLTSTSPPLPPNPTLTDIILASLSASSSAVRTAIDNAQAILAASAANPNRTNAASNCAELLGFSSRRLAQASTALAGGDPRHLDDARQWAGAALLYQYDCWSAFKYVNGTKQVDEAMWFLLSLQSLTSNALSMMLSLRRFGPDTSLWSPPQTERDGYWQDAVTQAAANADDVTRPAFYSPVAGPSDLTPDATVCKDTGSAPPCTYTTVQAAVDAAPEYGTSRFVIYIKSGTYEERVRIPFEKTNIAFVGDGMGKTIITGSLNAQMVGLSTYNTATVGVLGDGFYARDITFQNTAGPDAHQAVAYRSDSDLSVLQSVELLGHQDTLYVHSLRQFYNACRIAGTVDFVFGNSASVFQDCEILVQPRQLSPEKGETNAVTAQGRTDPAQPTGLVFRRCTVNGTEEYVQMYRQKPAAHKTYLGRPWKEYSRTVFVECYLGEIVRPEGWLPWQGDFALPTLYYGEYQSSGPGANPAGRVSWSSQIPSGHVGAYSVENFIQGDQWLPTLRQQ